MMEKIIEWPDDAKSPVLFFIDDLANAWVDTNGDGQIQPEEDMGYSGFSSNGALRYLEKEILPSNPEIKVTFFIPVGAREPAITNSGIKRISLPMNHDEGSRQFFRALSKNPKYELAYHGVTHGCAGKRSGDFKHEWEAFFSLDNAIETIKFGKEIYKEAVGEYPKGGKYCGYRSNQFSDDSIDKSDFVWWCRYYQQGAVEGHCTDKYETGLDQNPFTAYLPKIFGENYVVDIPTTFSGSTYGYFFKKKNSFSVKEMFKKMLRIYYRIKIRNRLNFLLRNNLVISIQEHMSPAREDMNRQSPNIFDDRFSLHEIFTYLKGKRVWYCTGSEFAHWVLQKKDQKNDS